MFEKFDKIPRLQKEVYVTEKIDGTNAQIFICPKLDAIFETAEWKDGPIDSFEQSEARVDNLCVGRQDDMLMFVGSRNRYISADDDNFGFAQWAHQNSAELFKFGPGRHYGEWWGQGIQRTYDLEEKRLSMFNPRWADQGPDCVDTVPLLGVLNNWDEADLIQTCMYDLKENGSHAAPGFMQPEGIVVFHSAANQLFKQTFDYDKGKWSDEQ